MNLRFLNLALLAFLGLGVTSLAAQKLDSLEGRLSDATGQGLPYVVLGLYDADNHLCRACQTDSLGRFRLGQMHTCRPPYHLRTEGLEASQSWPLSPKNDFLDLRVQELSQTLEEVGIQAQDLGSFLGAEAWLKQNASGTLAGRLEALPGIQAQTVGVGIAKPVVRGFSGNRLIFVQDGLRQEGQQWGNDHGLEADAFALEQVEILRGSLALRQGAALSGGVLSVEGTKLLPDGRIYLDAQQQYKSNNEHWASSLAAAGAWKGFNLAWRSSFQSYADYRVPASEFYYNGYVLPLYENRLKNTAGQEWNHRLDLSKSWQAGRALTRFGASFYRLDGGLFAGAVGIPRSYALEPDGDWRNRSLPSQRVQHTRLWLRHRQQLAQGSWFSLLGWQRNQRQELSAPHYHNGPTNDSSYLALTLGLQTWQTQHYFRSNRVNGRVWELGFSGQLQRNESGGFEFLLPNFNYQRAGVYGLWQQALGGDWQFDGGLRLEVAGHQSSAGGAYLLDNQGILAYQERVQALDRRFVGGAGHLELRRQGLAHTWSVAAQKSFRAPYANELSINGIHHGTFRHELGNPDLKAEEGWHLEGQWRYEGGKLKMQANVYSAYFTNYLFLQPSARFSPLPEAGQLYQQSQTQAWQAGFEWQLDWQLAWGFAYRQAVDGLYNRNLQTGYALPFSPPASSLQRLSWTGSRKAWGNLDLWLQHRWYVAQNAVDRNEKPTPGAQLWSAGLLWRTPWGFELGFQGENLLNTPYLRHLSRYRILDLPEQGRNLILSLRYTLDRG